MANEENPDLSIIILNYNVKELLLNCLESIFKNKKESDKWQIIVVDNASSDGSVDEVRRKYKVAETSSEILRFAQNDKIIELVANKENLGFAAGNNEGVEIAKAPVILFLNPDTIICGHAIQKSMEKLLSNPDIGALTCRVELPDGKLDYSCHRGFPTPLNALAYFTGLAKIFPRSPIFAGYTASYLDPLKSHEIDSLTGAFMMIRKIAGDQVGWWDTDYFWNGEDIEFCFCLKEQGWRIYYYADEKIIHYKGSSSGLWKTAKTKVKKEHKLKIVSHGVSAMRIFYMKHYYKKYPPLLRDIVLSGIKILEHYRKFKILTELNYE